MALLNVSHAQLADNEGTITCEHCQRRFTATITPDKAKKPPILDDQAQASLFAAALQPPPSSHTPLRWGWLTLSLLLALLLSGQITYFKRNELAEQPVLRPLLQTFCHYLHCELKLLRDIKQLRILSREVRSHPRIHNALQISLTIRNEALFRQPWPTLQLTFSDINNKIIARRSFRPRDYLPVGSNITAGMPSQTPVHTSLVLIDPGKEAVNFIFDFI